ncbi:MAG: protein phosphatase CheZ [Desulfovibrionaceae bacterium]|nr:protein phosphatase CheZ [Desulfovibrionaceae bacterium]MBF0514815.1 protein phosphatase CheZ [Desulfovibrionaceae bacterium]
MSGDQDILGGVVERVAASIAADLKDSIVTAVERQINHSLTRSLLENEFHKRLSQEMRGGLQAIYKEINAAKRVSDTARGENPEKLFNEAADQLDEILRATEDATGKIMDIVEKQQDMQERAGKVLHGLKNGGVTKDQLQSLREMSDALNADLMEIMTTLSFQDLTGQRIKRIVGAIKKVESIVLDLYLATGLKMQAHEQAPDKDLEQVEAETSRKMSELKGPQAGANQAGVDDLLAQLGM